MLCMCVCIHKHTKLCIYICVCVYVCACCQVIGLLAPLKKLDGLPVIREAPEEESDSGSESEDSEPLDEELFNDPMTQQIIQGLNL